MLKLENTEILGWEHAIRGMRNPMNSWEKSDSGWMDESKPTSDHLITNTDKNGWEVLAVGPNDRDLMNRLRNAGTDHRKFMRMIAVYVDLTGPLYWWKEFDTYKVGTVANSCSTMHKIAEKEFTPDDFSMEHLIDEPGCRWRAGFISMITMGLNDARKKFLATNDKTYWWQMIQLLPTSYNQKRTIMLNYEVLANIYRSRRNHKLDEWHTFCDWIESLPYSELITGRKDED
jgi:hypothetical protein